jgi:hypothetical protein
MDRGALVKQMAKAFAGESMMDPSTPRDELKRRAEAALARVELYLGVEIEEAKEIVAKVIEEVS